MTQVDEGQVWDAGLQPERTSLAWRRVALAFLGLALVTPQLAWTALGPWALTPALVVAGAAVTLLVGGHRRYLRIRGVAGPLPDGRLPLLTVCTTLILAALALAVVIAGATDRLR